MAIQAGSCVAPCLHQAKHDWLSTVDYVVVVVVAVVVVVVGGGGGGKRT